MISSLRKPFLMYISETKDIDPDKLKKILGDTKIEGGEIMPALAQRFRDEGKQEGVKVGKPEGKLETAKELLKNGVDIDIIAKLWHESIERTTTNYTATKRSI